MHECQMKYEDGVVADGALYMYYAWKEFPCHIWMFHVFFCNRPLLFYIAIHSFLNYYLWKYNEYDFYAYQCKPKNWNQTNGLQLITVLFEM